MVEINMLQKITKWFSPPSFKNDEDKTRIAGMLHVILLVLFAVIIVAILLGITGSVSITNVAFFTSSIFVGPGAVIFLLFMLRKGYVRFVAWAFVFFQWLSTVTQIFGSGGIESPAISAFIVTILLAGFLISIRAVILFSGLSILTILGAWQLEKIGQLPPHLVFESPQAKVFFIMTIMAVTAALLNLVIRALDNTLIRSRTYARELEQVIQQKDKAEKAMQQFSERLEILHEIDRSLISARPTREIAKDALSRIRVLIPCIRASATLFNFKRNEATFLNADFDELVTIPDSPIALDEYGLDVIEVLKQNKPWFTNDMLKESEVTSLDERLAHEGGIHSWLSLPLLYQGQLIGALNLGRGPGEAFNIGEAATAQDIANQLAIAIQQTRLYEALQKELAERQKLISELEANNAELERFTYTVSHDLRNPLVTIKGFLGMLDKDMQENRQDRVQTDFQRIAGAADKMDELLSDLLELSRIGRIVHPPEKVDVAELTRDAIEMLDAHIHSKNVNVLISSELPTLYGDRLRLREVLENLISNAVKYMGDQPSPTIEIGIRSEANEPTIFVRDNGIGIEERYQSRIFTLFEKLNPDIEGTGIGLALVKRIIEVHGGRIWVESDGLGKGSTFYFTIPNKTN
jgi:signal transduction histidine kinase